MSKRRLGTDAARPPDASQPEPWRPVRLVAYDLDSPSSAGLAASPDGARTWVEVRKGGRVIGLVEPVARDGERSTLDLVELEAMSADAAARADDQVPDSALAAASVVIPTICANPAQLVRAVTSLLAMDYPDFDVIVVDNRTDPRAAPLPVLPGGPRVRTVAEPRPGISSARNRGTSVSTGEFVAFTDDDAVVDPGWLRAIGTRFAVDDTVDAVGGLVLPLELDTEPQLWFEEFYGGFSRSFQSEVLSLEAMRGTDELFPYAPGRFGAGCNMAFRRPVLDLLGGFDTTLGVGTPARGGEDLAMFFGLVATGATVAFEPGAVVRHSHRRTEAEFLRQVRSYGTGLTAMYTAMVVHEPRHLVEMLRRVPAGIRLLTRPRATRSTSRAPGYPRRTLAYQMLGMAYGPFAYARSAARARRYR